MKKMVYVLAALLILGLCACSNVNGNKVSEDTKQEEIDNKDENENNPEKGEENLTDIISSINKLDVAKDNKGIQLGEDTIYFNSKVSVADLTKLGWYPYQAGEIITGVTVLNPGETLEPLEIRKEGVYDNIDGANIGICIKNTSNEPKQALECDVSSLFITWVYGDIGDIYLGLTNGVNIGKLETSIEEIYDKATVFEDGDYKAYYIFDKDANITIEQSGENIERIKIESLFTQ